MTKHILIPLVSFVLFLQACSKKDTASGGGGTTPTITAPTVVTYPVTSIQLYSAQSGGSVSSDGGSAITAKGICWSTTPNPTISSNRITDATIATSFVSSITGLSPNTTYYVKAYASNSVGVSYGSEQQFQTLPTSAPIVTTGLTGTTTTTFSSTISGSVVSDGGQAVSSRGICWSTSANPTLSNGVITAGSGTGNFSSLLSGLSANTTYYIRAYATNSLGTSYGDNTSIVTDIEGNIYNTLIIGTQTWLLENLKTTKYNDGTTIPYVSADVDWAYFSSPHVPKFCWYANDPANKDIYGGLYNFFVVKTGKLAPLGWHVPTQPDFKTLMLQLDPACTQTPRVLFDSPMVVIHSALVGGMLKETGSMHWLSPNLASNTSRFTALGGGFRQEIGGDFASINNLGSWWSSTAIESNTAYRILLGYNFTAADCLQEDYGEGMSVRCIKN